MFCEHPNGDIRVFFYRGRRGSHESGGAGPAVSGQTSLLLPGFVLKYEWSDLKIDFKTGRDDNGGLSC
jgi:hypothetical protein